MRRAVRWSWGVLCAVALAMSAVGGGAAEAPALKPAEVPKDKVWAVDPVQPWDETAVKSGSLAKVLDQSFSLARSGKPGEQHRYQFQRENMSLDRRGRTVQRTLFMGTVLRTLVKEKQPGVWEEKLTWERFGTGQSQGPNDVPVVNYLPGAAGFTYDFFPPTFDYLNPPGDYAKIGDPMLGYGLKVVTMDVAGFDAMMMALRGAAKHQVTIGETKAMPRWNEGLAIKAEAGAAVGGNYHLGPLTVSVAGLTRRNGEPCVLLWFTAEGNDVTQDVDSPQMTMHMKATEFFRGTMTVSARDGHVVAGELWGPLPMTLVMGQGGEPAAERPVSGMMQQVAIWEIPAPAAK